MACSLFWNSELWPIGPLNGGLGQVTAQSKNFGRRDGSATRLRFGKHTPLFIAHFVIGVGSMQSAYCMCVGDTKTGHRPVSTRGGDAGMMGGYLCQTNFGIVYFMAWCGC